MRTFLIDDDFISLYVAEHVLRLEAFAADIQLFTTGEAALSALAAQLPTQPPRVIFLDLNMPVMDGWNFLQALAPYAPALQNRCHIYILTSSLAFADTAKARDYPLVAGVLTKPLAAADVLDIKARLLPATEQEPPRLTE
jgi:CheY-like chemotaxis protein